MIDTRDMWITVKWMFWVIVVSSIGVGLLIGMLTGIKKAQLVNSNPNEIVGKLEEGSPKHSIPTNTMIVAACTDDCGVFAYVVKDTNGNHYYVGLLSREVRKIEEVNVIKLEKVICEPNRQEFKYKVQEL